MDKWIPVTEQLPDKDGLYLVSFPSLFGERRCIGIESFSHDLESVDRYGFKGRKRAGWYSYDDECGYLERDNVVAWMLVPEPYREDGDNDDAID